MLDKILSQLKTILSQIGLERFSGRFYGIYPGRVVSNQDPQGRGRVLATCPAVNINDDSDVSGDWWMMPCMNGVGTAMDGQMTGVFHPPEVGANVWVSFQFGDPQYPVYMGGFVTTKQVSDTFKSEEKNGWDVLKRGIRTKSGSFIRFNDDPDSLEITIVKGDGKGGETPQFIALDKDGSTLITNEKGSYLYMNAEKDETSLQTLDKKGNVLSMLVLGDDKISLLTKSGAGITVDGKNVSLTGDNIAANASKTFDANAGVVYLGSKAKYMKNPLLRGRDFAIGWGIIHQHTTTAPGSPTGPGPTPPVLPGKELSSNVFIS